MAYDKPPQVESSEKEKEQGILREAALRAKLKAANATAKQLEAELKLSIKTSMKTEDAIAMVEKSKAPLRQHANMLKSQVGQILHSFTGYIARSGGCKNPAPRESRLRLILDSAAGDYFSCADVSPQKHYRIR